MNSHQPNLPIRDEPSDHEYLPGDEGTSPWRVNDWAGLAKRFGLKRDEAVAWHHAVGMQGRPWLVARRLYGVAPLYSEDLVPEDGMCVPLKELASAQGVPESALQKDLEALVEFWNRARHSTQIMSHAKGDEESPGVDALPTFSVHQELEEGYVNSLLETFRFSKLVKHQGERFYVAHRILELKSYFEDPARREKARQIVIMELNLTMYETAMASMRQRLEKLSDKPSPGKDDDKDMLDLAIRIAATEGNLTKLAGAHAEACEDLGADEVQFTEKKRVAIDSLSYAVEAVRAYHSRGDRTLIDGVFTAKEVVWLTTPLTIRPAQYRADVVIRAKEAMLPENLWAPDYKPTPIERDACRRLARLVQGLAEEVAPAYIESIDREVDPGGDDDDVGVVSTEEVFPDNPAISSMDEPFRPPPRPSSEVEPPMLVSQ
jgi:hypothetical protein